MPVSSEHVINANMNARITEEVQEVETAEPADIVEDLYLPNI